MHCIMPWTTPFRRPDSVSLSGSFPPKAAIRAVSAFNPLLPFTTLASDEEKVAWESG